jgi:hypothetical protein
VPDEGLQRVFSGGKRNFDGLHGPVVKVATVRAEGERGAVAVQLKALIRRDVEDRLKRFSQSKGPAEPKDGRFVRSLGGMPNPGSPVGWVPDPRIGVRKKAGRRNKNAVGRNG